jgi:hypothetical protein
VQVVCLLSTPIAFVEAAATQITMEDTKPNVNSGAAAPDTKPDVDNQQINLNTSCSILLVPALCGLASSRSS